MKDEILYDYGHLWRKSAYRDETLALGVRKNLDQLDAIHKLAKDRAAKIKKGGTLTAKGVQEEFRRLAKELAGNLDDATAGLDGYRKQIANLEEKVKPTRHRQDDMAWLLELREIRDHIRSLDVTEAEAFVMQAATDGNEQVMEAVRYSPIKFKFATEEMIQRLDQIRSERQYPEETARLQDRRQAAQEVRGALGAVKHALGQLGIKLDGQDRSDSQVAA